MSSQSTSDCELAAAPWRGAVLMNCAGNALLVDGIAPFLAHVGM